MVTASGSVSYSVFLVFARLVLLKRYTVCHSEYEPRIWKWSISNPLQVPGRQNRLVFYEEFHWLPSGCLPTLILGISCIMVVTQGGCPGKLQGRGYAFLDAGWSSFLMCIYYLMSWLYEMVQGGRHSKRHRRGNELSKVTSGGGGASLQNKLVCRTSVFLSRL